MHKELQTSIESYRQELEKFYDNQLTAGLKLLEFGSSCTQLPHHLFNILTRYQMDFFIPTLKAMLLYQQAELKQGFSPRTYSWSTLDQYTDLFLLNTEIAHRAQLKRTEAQFSLLSRDTMKLLSSLLSPDTRAEAPESPLLAESKSYLEAIRFLDQDLPDRIKQIGSEFGFHFESGRHPVIAESERFILYQILPSRADVQTRQEGKPVLIVPPYVLGSDILCFLPKEERSYVHSFANMGIPTYIKILKDISTTPAVQTMTLEDDICDTQVFCRRLQEIHGHPVTLNGYCQGGFITMINLLSGKLDGLVDAHITCVAPLDGSKTKGLSDFLKALPPRFNNLLYGTKTLPNGRQVADGDLMSWIYKIKSIEDEDPIVSFIRDLTLFKNQKTSHPQINKSMAAVLYWLTYQRHDLPLEITKASFASFNHPISPDGTLPVKVFGSTLNIKRIKEMGIKWQICYGEKDTLVDKESTLAPLDFLDDIEIAPFPKGHVAIATHWSHPASECALHTRFNKGKYRGPVRFHLDLEKESIN